MWPETEDGGNAWTEGALKIIAWIRANLVVVIFGAMLLLQSMTWYSIVQLRQYLPSCSYYNPCTVNLTPDTAEAIGRAVVKSR